jgi:hypothetical protein
MQQNKRTSGRGPRMIPAAATPFCRSLAPGLGAIRVVFFIFSRANAMSCRSRMFALGVDKGATVPRPAVSLKQAPRTCLEGEASEGLVARGKGPWKGEATSHVVVRPINLTLLQVICSVDCGEKKPDVRVD